MKLYEWNEEKALLLKKERGVSFEDVVIAIEKGCLHGVVQHPNAKRYPNQRVLYVEIESYIYAVPAIETEERVFLKTIFPSRKASKNYLGGKKK